MQINDRPRGNISKLPAVPDEERKYPLKWAICYQGKPYLELYGKKKAYDLLHHLNKSFDGLSIVPVEPGTEKAARSLYGLIKVRKQKRKTGLR